MCYDPGNLTHGNQSGYEFTYPQTIQYWCDEGYNLIGSENRTCMEFGTWSRTKPTCAREYPYEYLYFQLHLILFFRH